LRSDAFTYRDRTLYCEEVALADIARKAGTPCYVYAGSAIRRRFRAYDQAFGETPHVVCYAVKANSNLSVLRLLAEAGAGFDIVSAGELFRVIKAGGDPAKTVFSGVGKRADEIEYAIEHGVDSFNCESADEMRLIDAVAARLGRKAHVAYRVNPDIDAKTHKYISTGLRENKFGVDIAEAPALYREALRYGNLIVEGVSCHIGSNLLDTSPVMEAVDRVLALVDELRAAGAPIRDLDLGGGLGIAYQDSEQEPSVGDVIGCMCQRAAGRGLTLKVEPGRSIVGPEGVLLTRVLYRKKSADKEFIVVDASMTELIRPALYDAWHDIIPLREAPERGTVTADVVGPVCESGDFLAKDREVANAVPGDFLAICTAGAYGFVQASNYNSRPKPPEILVEGSAWRVARARESMDDLIRGES
jgi:diaminopimelate decarboxylase